MLNSQTLCFEWLRSKKEDVKPSTYDKYEMIINNYLISFFDHNSLEQLNINIIKEYLMKLLNKGLSSSVVKTIKNVLKAIYTTYENQYGFNHIDFSLLKIEEEKKETAYLTDKQFKQLHQYCLNKNNDICLSILLAMDTGMMIGEIVALKVSDIDLENQLIHISKRAQRTKNDDIGSKTIYEVYDVEWPMLRDITIPKELFFYLQEYLKDKENDCYLTSNLYVVSEVTKLQRGLDRIGSKYGFKTTFKDLRNMYKERCLKSCMDMNILMELLGVQSLKLNLPENYKSSNEGKKRQVNKL